MTSHALSLLAAGHETEEAGHTAWDINREARHNRKPNSRLADGHETDGSRALQNEANSEGQHRPSLSAKRTRSDPSTDPLPAGGDPHVPRRKRSKPTELIRPSARDLELLAASNSAATGT